MKENTNYILLRWPTTISELGQSKLIAKEIALNFGERFDSVRICYSNTFIYIYFGYSKSRLLTQIEFDQFALELSPIVSNLEIEISRLDIINDLRGTSNGATCPTHYVVEMDFEDGWRDEVFDWYDKEHLPGLAAVDGCIRAVRFANHDSSPHSHAFYELIDINVTSTDAWLKIRRTPWSDRLRPHFINVRRTVFSIL